MKPEDFSNRNYTIFAVDFDGVLCENKWPEIGAPLEYNLCFIKELRRLGNKVILWTCRSGLRLDHAIEWCRERGLEFDAVNENLIEAVVAFGGDTRKIYADYYIDDKAVVANFATDESIRRTDPHFRKGYPVTQRIKASIVQEVSPYWSKTIEQRIADGEIDPAYFFEGGTK
jgi:hypothetical protein